MSNPWIVASPKQAALIDTPTLVAAARDRFGTLVSVDLRPDGPMDAEMWVRAPGEPPFSITRSRDGRSLHVDGTPVQNADVAAWVRGLLPSEFPRLIAFDQGWTGHAELPAGVTAEDVTTRWIDHSVQGWNAGDPDLS